MNPVNRPGPGIEVELAGITATREFAYSLGKILKAADLLILTGELGAGKTTFTQGLGHGMGVREGIISPTFVLSRIHPALGNGPDLVHVDAYRLGGAAEVDDLDLEASMSNSVTVVEWGSGKVDQLSDSRLEIVLLRPGSAETHEDLVFDFHEGEDDEPRTLKLTALGPRWENDGDLGALLDGFTNQATKD